MAVLRIAEQHFGKAYDQIIMETKQQLDAFGDDLNQWIEHTGVPRLKAVTYPLVVDTGAQGVRTMAAQLGMSFNILQPALLDYASRETEFLASVMGETLGADVTRIVQGSLEQGETMRGLAQQLRDSFTFSRDRSKLVARTETCRAWNGAQQRSLSEFQQESGKPCFKVWLTAQDDRVRPEHEEMEGEQRGIDEEFSNGLMAPGEPNCRCTLIYQVGDEIVEAPPSEEIPGGPIETPPPEPIPEAPAFPEVPQIEPMPAPEPPSPVPTFNTTVTADNVAAQPQYLSPSEFPALAGPGRPAYLSRDWDQLLSSDERRRILAQAAHDPTSVNAEALIPGNLTSELETVAKKPRFLLTQPVSAAYVRHAHFDDIMEELSQTNGELQFNAPQIWDTELARVTKRLKAADTVMQFDIGVGNQIGLIGKEFGDDVAKAFTLPGSKFGLHRITVRPDGGHTLVFRMISDGSTDTMVLARWRRDLVDVLTHPAAIAAAGEAGIFGVDDAAIERHKLMDEAYLQTLTKPRAKVLDFFKQFAKAVGFKGQIRTHACRPGILAYVDPANNRLTVSPNQSDWMNRLREDLKSGIAPSAINATTAGNYKISAFSTLIHELNHTTSGGDWTYGFERFRAMEEGITEWLARIRTTEFFGVEPEHWLAYQPEVNAIQSLLKGPAIDGVQRFALSVEQLLTVYYTPGKDRWGKTLSLIEGNLKAWTAEEAAAGAAAVDHVKHFREALGTQTGLDLFKPLPPIFEPASQKLTMDAIVRAMDEVYMRWNER